MKQRKVWIDWMKGLGMLTIIWGHCFPEGMSAFIYAFNVPVFFIVSGYLTRRETTFLVCWDKVLHNLIIPYFILATIKAAGYMLHHLADGQWLWSLIAIFGGFHQLHDASGCSNLWFVYALILIRILYQWQPDRRLLLSVLAFVGALVYNYLNLDWVWSVTNLLLALPFFMLGNMLADSAAFGTLTRGLIVGGVKYMFPLAMLCIIVTYMVGYYNDTAAMYQGQYGNYLSLFLIGALTGSGMVWLLSLMLRHVDGLALRITSMGTIVTLVFHRELLHPLLKWIRQQDFGIVVENLLMFLSSVLVLLAFIPIIMIVKRFFPIVQGRRSKLV